jgi:hypothetical protein
MNILISFKLYNLHGKLTVAATIVCDMKKMAYYIDEFNSSSVNPQKDQLLICKKG